MAELFLVEKRSRFHFVFKRPPVIFWIVTGAFLIRLWFLLSYPPPPPSQEGDDGLHYTTSIQIKDYFVHAGDLLKEFVSGNLFRGAGVLQKYGLEIPWGALRRGPIYCTFVAFIFFVTGSTNPFLIYLVQAILTSLAGVFLYAIAKQMGYSGAGLLAAFFLSIYSPLIFMAGKVMQESVTIFILTAFFYVFSRLKSTSCLWIFGFTGIFLFIASLTKNSLVFFPFFLFIMLAFQIIRQKSKPFGVHQFLVLLLTFLCPYLIWMGIVSSQFHRPGTIIVSDNMGRVLFLESQSQFGHWLPDVYFRDHIDLKTVSALQEAGVEVKEMGGELLWPDESKLKLKTVAIYFKSPLTYLAILFERLRRLWWDPFGRSWIHFLFRFGPFHYLHRFLIIAAILGGILLWFDRYHPQVGFLWLALGYGTILSCIFHVESRYALIYMPIIFLFAGIFLWFVWSKKRILFRSFPQGVLYTLIVAGSISFYHFSHLAYLIWILPFLSSDQIYFLMVALKNVSLISCFVVTAFWLSPVMKKKHLITAFLILAFVILIPFNVYAWNALEFREWTASIRKSVQIVRQEIVLPRGSFGGAKEQHLRIDLEFPSESPDIQIEVNGKAVGDFKTLVAEENKSPFFIPAYAEWMRISGQKFYEFRQWFKVPLPAGLLKEGGLNIIDIRSKGDNETRNLKRETWKICGDYLITSPNRYEGPLFHHFASETSIFKFFEDGDFRLRGATKLHHQASQSSLFDGQKWRYDDLSLAPGIQKGQYRIRLEIKLSDGQHLIF
jgi:4-amino-4-deoxy-L-arabinose transferase-like glycosyltransferase